LGGAVPSLEWVNGAVGSVEGWFRPPQPLDSGTALIAFDAALACRRGGLGCSPFERRTRRAADKIQQALACILSVARLRTMPLRGNDNDPIAGQSRARLAFPSGSDLSRQR